MPYLTSLHVTELPEASLGLYFRFKVRVFTAFATEGIDSGVSTPMVFADLPGRPEVAPQRLSVTSESVVGI